MNTMEAMKCDLGVEILALAGFEDKCMGICSVQSILENHVVLSSCSHGKQHGSEQHLIRQDHHKPLWVSCEHSL